MLQRTLTLIFCLFFCAIGALGFCVEGDPALEPLDLDINAAPAGDQTAEGLHCDGINAGESITIMDCVYLHSDGEWHKANASSTTTSTGMLAISLESKTDGQLMNVAFPGSVIRNDSWSWTTGGTVFLDTNDGNLTQTAPTGADSVTKIVGYAVNGTRLFFYPEQTNVVHD